MRRIVNEWEGGVEGQRGEEVSREGLYVCPFSPHNQIQDSVVHMLGSNCLFGYV